MCRNNLDTQSICIASYRTEEVWLGINIQCNVTKASFASKTES